MWNLRYYSDWIDDKGNENRVEIHSHLMAGTQSIRLTGFSIHYPEFDLFSDKAVYGAGANLTIVSENALDYLDELYTINPKGLLLKHYVGSTLNFTGYLDTEQYRDDFFNPVNYDFSISANNGIAVLDRIKISDDTDSELSGIYNALDVVKFALNKLEISYDNIYMGVSSTIEGLASDETILHKLNVKAANYVDEKGNWMSCREVINAILLPLTLKLFVVGNDVYIVDINSLADDNITLKQYSFSDLTYVQDVTNSNVFDIDKVVNSNVLTKQPGVSKVDVKFNKYVYDNVIKSPLDLSTFSDLVSDTNVTNSEGSEYNIKRYKNCVNYTNLDTNDDTVYFEKITNVNKPSEVDYTARVRGITPVNNSPVFSVEVETDLNLLSSKNLYLKLFGDIMVCDDSDFYKERIINDYFNAYFYVQYKVGSQYYNPYSGWSETASNITAEHYDYYSDGNNDARYTINKWHSLENGTYINGDQFDGILIPLTSDLFQSAESIDGGKLTIKIGMYTSIMNLSEFILRFKNLGVGFVEKDEWGNYLEVSNADDEYQGKIDSYYINDLQVETKQGTDSEANSRGMFILRVNGVYTDSDYATNERYALLNSVSRNGFSGTSEELLLRTYLSNLQLSRYKYNTTLLSYHSILDRFKYKLYRDSVQCTLLPVGMTCDYLRGESTVNLLEIVKDE
ncbi:hypothetical protein [Marinilabilia salmonicolor]|uniref:Uncharacterized protein n=1 Tax=Marinilabilia salmonicolor TaxID=989 RepID=A0A368VBV5_9BACT|nr:hypothetical protein [Marinilabilia salmonicolor]RCW38659.1 hypothetical protein DFO77_103129 [Marinilabilia salmonicolor]